MKKLLSVILASLMLFSLGACGGARDEIVVAQREAGSGTRDAFESIFSVKNEVTGKLIYSTTGALKTSVSSDKYAIGYISLGAVDSSVKAVKIEGAEATEANILSGTYAASRPFNMITNASVTLSDAATDFLSFVYSNDGQDILNAAKLIKAQPSDGASGAAYATPSGSIAEATVILSGSTSMEESVSALVEKYTQKQPNVTFSKSFMGSSAGKTDVSKTDGTRADIGLVSSALSADDLTKFNGHKVATDGLAIIVNNKNSVIDLTKEQIVKIFKGEIKNWSEIG